MLDTQALPISSLRTIAFYLPQFHPITENDRFWGPGFSEWHNVTTSRPRFRGHVQPHLPADLGFYDLRLPETRLAQARMARNAGVSGFCYYHYWFNGKRLLETPFNQVLATGRPSFPFMLCWANENWTRAWDGGAREVLLAQHYSDADTINHARALAPIFADPRYICIGGRPVFVLYNADELPDPKRWTDLFRETISPSGPEPYLIRVERHLDRDQRPPAEIGFDAALEFQPFSRNFRLWLETRPDLKQNLGRRITHRLNRELGRFQSRDRRIDMSAFVAFDMCQPAPRYTTFPGVTPSWDNSARRPAGKAIIFEGSSPTLFRDWVVAKTRSFQPPSADENFLFINAWNEWAEGSHLEPCRHYGHAWLDALREGLSQGQKASADAVLNG